MLHHLERVRPETIRVYATCIAHRRRFGSYPSAEVVERLAVEEGASPAAALALVRFEARDESGKVVSLNDYGLVVVVREPEQLRAILARSATGPKATLKSPWGRVVHWRKLPVWVEAWETGL